jgi:UTP--glucose-1-phosphate uridylyltransferase
MATVRKAVIPAAGRGTRFLPASKAIPKELLPIVDRPALQWVVEDARDAGLDSVAIVTSPGKDALAAHFAADPELEAFLEASGETAILDGVRHAVGLGPLTFVVQEEPRGLGDAILVAEEFAAGEAFAVLLGDDFCDRRDPILDAMVALHERTGMSVILLMEAPPEQIRFYSSVDVAPFDVDALRDAGDDVRFSRDLDVRVVRRANEKPEPGEEYSSFAIVGKYVFGPGVFDALRNTPPGHKGEVQLTDAIDRLARTPADEGGGVLGVVYRGRRYDTGTPLEYLKTVVSLATADPDVGEAFSTWLYGFVEDGEGGKA